MTRTHDQALRCFVLVTGTGTFGILTPWGHRRPTTGCPAFTTTVWVVDRVHRDTAHGWADALVTVTTGFTDVLVAVVGVGHGTDGGHAFLTDQTQFTRRQADLRIAAIATYTVWFAIDITFRSPTAEDFAQAQAWLDNRALA